MNYLIIPKTGMKLFDGSIVILKMYPNKKWIVRSGRYTNQNCSSYGWYFSSIEEGEVIPITLDNLRDITIVSLGDLPTCPAFPEPPCHHPAEFTEDRRWELDRAFIIVENIEDLSLFDIDMIPNGKIIKVTTTPEGPKYFTWNRSIKCWETEMFGIHVEEFVSEIELQSIKTSLDSDIQSVRDVAEDAKNIAQCSVSYELQNYSEKEKLQARQNIGAMGNIPVTYIDSTSTVFNTPLSKFAPGLYILDGQFKLISANPSTLFNTTIVSIICDNDWTYIMWAANEYVYSYRTNDIILNDNSIHVSDIQTLDNQTDTIDDSSTDDQYPTAKAVYSALQAAVKEVGDELKAVSDEVGVEVQAVRGEVKVVSDEVKVVSDNLTEVRNEVKSVSDEVKSVSDGVKEVGDEVKSVSDEVKSVSDEVHEVQESVEQNLQEVTSTIQQVQENVQEIEANIKDVQETVQQVQENVQQVQENVQEVNDKVQELSETMQGVSDAVDAVISMPASDEKDNGKFLRIVDGVPTWTQVINAKEVEF